MSAAAEARALDVLEALAHPLRNDLLETLERDVLSPTELAERLRQSLADVVYHLGRLADLGLAELVERRIGRGCVQTYYRRLAPPMLDDETLAQLGTGPAELVGDALATTILGLGGDAPLAPGAASVRVERVAGRVDERGRAEVVACVEEFSAELEGIAARAYARAAAAPPRGGATPHCVSVLEFALETPRAPASSPGSPS